MKKIFLGGTCAGNTKWREELVPMLKIDSFNPVAEDWTEECMAEEIRQRKNCDYVLYTITPSMKGVYSIAEVVDDSNKQPRKTIFCVSSNYEGKKFTKGQMKSLNQVGRMIQENGGSYFGSLDNVAYYLNEVVGG